MAQSSKFAEKLLAETTGTSVTLFSKEDGKCQIRRLTAGEGGVAPKGGGEANGMERTCEGAFTLVAKPKKPHNIFCVKWYLAVVLHH